MDNKTESVVAAAEVAVKTNLFTPKRLLVVAGVVVVGAGVALFLKNRKNSNTEVEETVPVATPKHVNNGNKK